jgi:hypothetical protein
MHNLVPTAYNLHLHYLWWNIGLEEANGFFNVVLFGLAPPPFLPQLSPYTHPYLSLNPSSLCVVYL